MSRIVTNPDGTKTVRLRFPLKIGGARVPEIQLRRPTVGDRLDAQRLGLSEAQTDVHLIAAVAGLAPDDLHAIDVVDHRRLIAAYKEFLKTDPKAHATVVDSDGVAHVMLQFPLTIDGATVHQIRLRRPTVGDMLEVDKPGRNDAEAEVHMISLLSGLTAASLRPIDLADYRRISDAHTDFFEDPEEKNSGKP